MARQGLLNALIAQEQLRGTPPENRHTPLAKQVLVDASDLNCYIAADHASWFEPCVELGEKVATGTLVARLHDFDQIDAPPREIRAPHTGYITTQAWKAKVERGQVITVVAPQIEWLS
jgi:predicted deacylase